MARRRRRQLSPDESALWHQVARTARPIRATAPADADLATFDPVAAEPALPDAGPPLEPRVPAPRLTRTHAPRGGAALAPDPFGALAAAPSRLDGRRAERLRRGKLQPERRLDLHGMSRERAHGELISFILRAQADGIRLVLVITGKGRPDPSDTVIPERRGVLRNSVPHWLAAPPLTGRVVEARPAHPRHGGAGALYLYLRRRVDAT